MTKEEALALKIGKQSIFIYEPSIDDVYSAKVTGVIVTAESGLHIHANSRAYKHRVYQPNEAFITEVEAWRRYSRELQGKADAILKRKYGVDHKVLELEKEG